MVTSGSWCRWSTTSKRSGRSGSSSEEEEERLRRDGIPFNSGYKLGILVETPAAALEAVELARHSDFFSIGTNDLTQYTLAVDRTSARLAKLFNPFHPAVVHQLSTVSRVAKSAGIEVSVCGEMAANPLGAFLLLGLDITTLSVAWPSLPEVKKMVRCFCRKTRGGQQEPQSPRRRAVRLWNASWRGLEGLWTCRPSLVVGTSLRWIEQPRWRPNGEGSRSGETELVPLEGTE